MSDGTTNQTRVAGGPATIGYAPARPPRVGVFGVVGLASALAGAVVVAMICLATARDLGSNLRIDVNLSPNQFYLPGVGAILCVIGFIRREKRLIPAVGAVIALLAMVAIVVLGNRVWGRPLPGGASPRHWPQFG